tara:strand:+ start:2119 stop:2463 length:345 start_codon:yes stop_codon:yes gene_type:complete
MKKILLAALILVSTNANAFYTTYEYDINRLREGVYKQQGTVAQKEAFMQKMVPVIQQARAEAYTRVVEGCVQDLRILCQDAAATLDAKVKCISDNQAKLSKTCKFTISENFRKR